MSNPSTVFPSVPRNSFGAYLQSVPTSNVPRWTIAPGSSATSFGSDSSVGSGPLVAPFIAPLDGVADELLDAMADGLLDGALDVVGTGVASADFFLRLHPETETVRVATATAAAIDRVRLVLRRIGHTPCQRCRSTILPGAPSTGEPHQRQDHAPPQRLGCANGQSHAHLHPVRV